jgi:tetratricopeptide (TPR) repeat protein
MSRPRVIGWLLVLGTLLAYLPALHNGFVNLDDPDYVTANPMVQQGVTWVGVQWAFTGWHASNWHPLTWLSHMMDCELFRLNPSGHHLGNVLLHAANVGLLFVLWQRLTGAVLPSAVLAGLFAWHPLHVESVAWVSERKDVLSTFFGLLALLSYRAHAQRPEAPTPSVFPASRNYWLAVLWFALSLMSKPMLVTLPFVMLLLDFWPMARRAPILRLLAEKWPFLLLTLASCAVTILAQRAEAIASLDKYSLGLRLENVVTAYAGYLVKAFWPVHLAVFYPLQPPSGLAVAGAAGLLLGLSALVWRLAPARPYLAVGWLWYLGTLVPVIGLVQVGDQALADRYTYFPLIGIFLAVVWTVHDWATRSNGVPRPAATAIAIAVAGLAACLALTEHQLPFWRDSEALFSHALAVTPDNAAARLNLGSAYQADNRPEQALAEYKIALRLDSRRHEIYNNIGRLLSDAGRPAEALDYCRTAVLLDPASAASHIGLGVVLSELGRYDEALNEFAAAARLNAGEAAPHFQAGRTLLKLGRDGEAAAQFHEALRIDPDNLAMVVFIARIFAADSDPQGRDGAAALALVQQASAAGGAGQPAVLDTLAMACAETGHYDEAVQAEREAVAAATASGAREDATNMEQRLGLYQQHQPARISFKTE